MNLLKVGVGVAATTLVSAELVKMDASKRQSATMIAFTGLGGGLGLLTSPSLKGAVLGALLGAGAAVVINRNGLLNFSIK